MSAIPTMHIPIVVNTEQVAPAMKKVEKTITDSAQRIGKIRGAVNPALGALGAGPLGGVLSGMGALGAGGMAGGLGVGMALAPFLVANKIIDGFASATKGASDALDNFNKTGEQTFAANSAVLRALANMEKSAQDAAKSPTLAQSFAAGYGMAGNQADPGALRDFAASLDAFSSQASSFLGAGFGGASLEQSINLARMSTANEVQSRDIARQVREEDRITKSMYGEQGPGLVEEVMDAILQNSLILEQMLGKMR